MPSLLRLREQVFRPPSQYGVN
jgi:hypothetical protein